MYAVDSVTHPTCKRHMHAREYCFKSSKPLHEPRGHVLAHLSVECTLRTINSRTHVYWCDSPSFNGLRALKRYITLTLREIPELLRMKLRSHSRGTGCMRARLSVHVQQIAALLVFRNYHDIRPCTCYQYTYPSPQSRPAMAAAYVRRHARNCSDIVHVNSQQALTYLTV